MHFGGESLKDIMQELMEAEPDATLGSWMFPEIVMVSLSPS